MPPLPELTIPIFNFAVPPVPLTDGANVPVSDGAVDADRSLSHEVLTDLSEINLSADLGRVIEQNQELAEGHTVRIKNLEAELEAHMTSLVVAVRENSEADISSLMSNIQNEHLAAMVRLQQSMSSEATAQLFAQRVDRDEQ